MMNPTNDNDPAPEVTVRYRCTSTPEHINKHCSSFEGPDCPGCDKFTNTKTKRSLPTCEKYQDELSAWTRVYMSETAEGQRFFHGSIVWEQAPGGEPGDLVETVKMTSQVPPFSEIHGCQHGNAVYFYVAKVN